MNVLWLSMAAEDLAWLLARLQTLEAQQEFLSLLRYALGGIPASTVAPDSPHVAGVEELTIPRWPFLVAYKRERGRVVILRLLPRYGRFADR
ncbi:MAG: hypothetical protein HC869_09535 [Rhodospirillales bacterium]|nr:hypothetical protein [Rhodospirillales bacterium]